VDGDVVEVNDALTDNLGTINEDPYGGGWLIKVRVKGKAPASLLGVDEYEKLIAETA
jgi:glycine cleavage system H protein